MPFKFFIVPIQDSGNAEAELNAFLRGKKILSVDRRWVEEAPRHFGRFASISWSRQAARKVAGLP